MLPNNLSPIANHLWQSTLFFGAAWLLTLTLRNNRAAVRYWLWLAASAKFLIPFSWLFDVGSRLGWRSGQAVTEPEFITAVAQISRPFDIPAQISTLPLPLPAPIGISLILGGVWLFGAILGLVFWVRSWRRIRAVKRAAVPLDLNLPIPVKSSSTRMEPSVFGIRKPVLVLPAGVIDRLTPAQLDAVLAHELCHVRRMDNLTAAIHMVVEIIFWFYPLVWWIRTQLVLERERACDEEVISSARDPQVYAEGILNVCKFYLESPLACVSGVSGADLKKRIETIMASRIAQRLDCARKLLLAAAGTAAVVVPIAVGLLNAPANQAQTLSPTDPPVSYVASIKLNKDGRLFSEYSPAAGRLTATAITVGYLLRLAYPGYQIAGLPDWISRKRYDITAKADGSPAPSQQVLLRALLKDRFKLAVHNETRDLPVFALVVARRDGKLGPQLTKSSFDCAAYLAGPHPPPEPGRTPDCAMRIGLGALYGKAISMATLATRLAPFVSRITVDKTGLTGGFDVELTWTPDQRSPNPAENPSSDASSNSSGPSIVTALQEQLGLKLVSETGPVAVLVVDRIEEPSAN
jgi:uncharacterized protein (TIGR03435 family)